MNRKMFIKQIEKMWKEDGMENHPLTIEELLDDAATLGLEGASKCYVDSLDINPNTGKI